MKTLLIRILRTTVHACRGSRQIALLSALVFIKDRRTGEPVPQAAIEELLNQTLAFRRNRTVTFIHNERNRLLGNLILELLILR